MATPLWGEPCLGGAWGGAGGGCGRRLRAPARVVQGRCGEAESRGPAAPRPLNPHIPDERARQYFLHCQRFSSYYGSFITPIHHYHQSFCREVNHNDNFGRHCKHITNNVRSHPSLGNAEARSVPSLNACATCSWGREPTGSSLPHSRLCSPRSLAFTPTCEEGTLDLPAANGRLTAFLHSPFVRCFLLEMFSLPGLR